MSVVSSSAAWGGTRTTGAPACSSTIRLPELLRMKAGIVGAGGNREGAKSLLDMARTQAQTFAATSLELRVVNDMARIAIDEEDERAPIPWVGVVSLAMIPVGSGVFMPSFWCIPTIRFSGPSAASAVALVSAVGSIGGFVGPVLIGTLKRPGGTDVAAFLTLAGIGLAGCGLGLLLRRATASNRHRSIGTSIASL